ncbi:MAG: TauD/TfdA dioxygenase family protein, partial [Acetobacteraceae bacterium]
LMHVPCPCHVARHQLVVLPTREDAAMRLDDRIKVAPIAGAVGAELSGVDLSLALADAAVAVIREAWLAHGVVFFRNQDLPPERLLGLARRFGTVLEYPFLRGLDEYPEVVPVVKLQHERSNFGGVWHSDTAYLPQPPMGTMLVAREVPPFGGDTLFASQTCAYDALSDGMRRMLEGLRAVNSSAKAEVSKTREDRVRDSARNDAKRSYEAEHPVVRTHPETGRKALYVNIAHTQRFVGMTDEESAPLLGYLFRHQVRPEFTCRFRWAPGSVAFWDNRCTLHNPVNDYHGHRRVMHRVTLAGDTPR